ncbi:MAG: FAD-dependent thymidylate synthase [Richelia sp. RM2_1_2]|nr:FAD-dependent thymidylate synthase [Richelia sp. RM2_1_2]
MAKWEKDVFEVELENGYKIEMTEDHLCLTDNGWKTLKQATNCKLSKNNSVSWNDLSSFSVNGIEAYKDKQSFAKVKSIKYIGEKITYDLSVSGPYHNFVANGFIVHNSINEISGRYSILPYEFYFPELENVRQQSAKNKQVSEGALDQASAKEYLQVLEELCEKSYKNYEDALQKGIGREQARMCLPINIYTEWYWKCDLHNILHFLALRCDAHAQQEIRVFADAMKELIAPIVPVAIEAWEDYHPMRSAIILTGLEIKAVKKLFE